jgi:hypothetical protein
MEKETERLPLGLGTHNIELRYIIDGIRGLRHHKDFCPFLESEYQDSARQQPSLNFAIKAKHPSVTWGPTIPIFDDH